MGMQALNQGILTLKNPVMWIYPIIAGLFVFAAVMFGLADITDYFGLKLAILFFIFVSPFFIAGTYAAVKSGDFSVNAYLKSAAGGYFRVMLPCFLLLFAIILLTFIATVPAFFTGAAGLSVFAYIIGIALILLTFFFDTAAIFEDKKIFESLKRSIELVMAKPLEVILFYIVAALLVFVLFMGYTMVWSSLLAEEFEPLLTMSQSELAAFSQDPANLVSLLGEHGVFVTAVLAGIAVLLFTLLFMPYKAIFYRDELTVSLISMLGKIPEKSDDSDLSADDFYKK